MTVKESIAGMLDQIASGDKEGANQAFMDVLNTKLSAALENMKVDVANQMFNGVNESVEELDEISVGLAARAASYASDPDYTGNASAGHIADMAGKKHGKKIGDQINDTWKGHWPKEYGSEGKTVPGHRDKLAWRKNRSADPNMTTKSGKLTKTAQKGLKSDIKRDQE